MRWVLADIAPSSYPFLTGALPPFNIAELR